MSKSAPLFLNDWKAEGPAWVQAAQHRAHTGVMLGGLPTPKIEGFKYSNVARAVTNLNVVPQACAIELCSDFSFVGRLPDVLDDASEWVRENLARYDATPDQAFVGLNAAYAGDGLVFDVPGKIAEPVFVSFKNSAGMYAAPRVLVRVQENADLTFVESIDGAGWINRVVQIELMPGARLNHVRIENPMTDMVLTQTTQVRQAAGSAYRFTGLHLGCAMARHDLDVWLLGAGADATIHQATLAGVASHADLTATVRHLAPGCRSDQQVRTVLGGQARGVFQGAIRVDQAAQKTEAYQLSRAVLLSALAEMDTKPELEIFADDVKCTHGATTGALDEEALFYLQSRGIGAEAARALLIDGFLRDVLPGLPEAVETCFSAAIAEKLKTLA